MRPPRAWILIAANFVLILTPVLADDIQGKVLQDHTGAVLPSAEIKIWKPGVRILAADLETDREGRFRAPGLPAGEYRVEVSKPSHIATAMQLKLMPGDPVVFRLVRCGSISGKVTDSQNRPVRGATVYAISKPAGDSPLRPYDNVGGGRLGPVDASGHYRIYNLPPGQYVIAVSYGASTLAVGSSGDETIDPTIGSGMTLYPSNARPQTFTISGGEEFRGADFSLAQTTLYSVSGRVALPAASRFVYWLALASVDQPGIAFAVTQAKPEGEFHFKGIAPGSYFLFASGPSNARNSRGAFLPQDAYYSRARVDVGGQNIEALSISVDHGRTLAFSLRRATASQPANACAQSLRLMLIPTEDWAAILDRQVSLNMGAEQTVTNVAPARYHLGVTSTGDVRTGDLCFTTAPQIVDLTSSTDPGPIVVSLAPAGSIRGRIDATGARPSDYAVVLIPAEAFDAADVKIAFPDADSRFTFVGLRPGRYRIAAQPAAEASKSRWLGDLTKMLEFEVRSGAPAEIELAAPLLVKNP